MGNSNSKNLRILAILLVVIFAALGAVYGYGKHVERVDTLQKTVRKADANEKAIIGIQKDIEYIKQAVDRIEKKIE